jgi:fluoroquinolone transport system permease protein
VLLAAFCCPLVALFLAAFAENKVAGFALVKLVNTVGLLPVAAYFLPIPWQYAAGIVPMYWPLAVLWLGIAGNSFWPAFLVGLAVNMLALAALVRRFAVVVHR